MAWADQSFERQRENLVTNFLPSEVPRLVTSSDRAGENGITNNRDVGSVFRPGANNIRGAILGMAWRVTVRDSEAAQVDEIVGTIPLIDGSIFGAGMQSSLWES